MLRGRFLESGHSLDAIDVAFKPHVTGAGRSLSVTKSFACHAFRSYRIPDVGQIVHGPEESLQGDPVASFNMRVPPYARGGTIVVMEVGGSSSRSTSHGDEATFDAERVACEHPNASIPFVMTDPPTFVTSSSRRGAKRRVVTVRTPCGRAATQGSYQGGREVVIQSPGVATAPT